ncbi:hypothetical protein [Qipengyuania atrilutea]|uniref:Uncharacterized protein n=1 Tax=Qipengyuania atrilutea TaxID=2744473 RepID=A0A850H5R1_9SPHN|nr:hypothetical protein [Actirhodobacter atriluteus]NVD45183.1 hypothetical protein [Actirhodobacter atriluteus]
MSAPAKTCATACLSPYHVPDAVRLKGIGCARYGEWLERQAQNCKRRDPVEHRRDIEEYRQAIHKAVEKSSGVDCYTGEPLEWNRLNHDRPKGGGQHNHRIMGHYPTVDHYYGTGRLEYRICCGSVNHAKGALDHQQFVELCRKVARRHEGWGKA